MLATANPWLSNLSIPVVASPAALSPIRKAPPWTMIMTGKGPVPEGMYRSIFWADDRLAYARSENAGTAVSEEVLPPLGPLRTGGMAVAASVAGCVTISVAASAAGVMAVV